MMNEDISTRKIVRHRFLSILTKDPPTHHHGLRMEGNRHAVTDDKEKGGSAHFQCSTSIKKRTAPNSFEFTQEEELC